jgi:hypothetical protein
MTGRAAPRGFLEPMRHVLQVTGIGFAALVPLGTAAGWWAGGSTVGLGILLGLAIPAVFFGVTVLTGVLAAHLDNSPFVGVVMAFWLVKIVALMVVMAVIKDADFYAKPAFLGAFIVGVAGWLAAEVIVVLRTRVPYVEVTGGPGDLPDRP